MKSIFKTFSLDEKPLIDSSSRQFSLIKSGNLQAVSDKQGTATNYYAYYPLGYVPPEPEKDYIVYKMDINFAVCPIFAVYLNLSDTSNNWQKLETIHYLSCVRHENGKCTVYFYSNKKITNEQLINYQIYVFDLVKTPAIKIGLNTWNENGELTFSTFSSPFNIIKTGMIDLIPSNIDFNKAPTQSFMDFWINSNYSNLRTVPKDIKNYYFQTGAELYIKQSQLFSTLLSKDKSWVNVKDDVHFISVQNCQKCAVVAQHRTDLPTFTERDRYYKDKDLDDRFMYRMDVHSWYTSASADWHTGYANTRKWINDGTLRLRQVPTTSPRVQYDVMGVNNSICFSIQPNFMSVSADGSGVWRANKDKLSYFAEEIITYHVVDVTNLPFPYN